MADQPFSTWTSSLASATNEEVSAGDLPIDVGVTTKKFNILIWCSSLFATIAMTFKASTVQIADATLGTGTHTFDFSAGNVQKLTATGNITIVFSNVPVSKYSTFVIYAVNWGAYTITLPTHLTAGGTVLTFTAAGKDEIVARFDKDGTLHLSVSKDWK